jgi:hypothetical protein
MTRGGVYVWRTRKPGAAYNLPIISRHFAYVGQTSSFWHRDRQHRGWTQTIGGPRDPLYLMGTETPGKPWMDLDPAVYHVGLPNWKWLRLAIEAMLIWALFPVYNVQLNRHNPRRITPYMAGVHRAMRDRGRRPINFRLVHAWIWCVAVLVAAWLMHKGGAW